MSNRDRDVLDALLRSNLAAFAVKTFQTISPGVQYLPNWHIDAICYQLERCYRREIRRLIITVPPRYGKSLCASVAFPAWVLGQDPSHRLVSICYNIDLVTKHSRDCRSVLLNPWYRKLFPRTVLDPSKMGELEIATMEHGCRFSTSIGGTLTGRGGNFFIIDDPLKPEEAASEVGRRRVNEWLDGSLLSRLDDKQNDVIIIVMQRLHADDLVGHALQKGGWHHLNLPAIAQVPESIQIGPDQFKFRQIGDLLHPEREPVTTLDEIRTHMGSAQFTAQYLQDPAPPAGNIVKWDWFKSYRDLPPPNPKTYYVLSWDTAQKASELNDYSVCTVWRVDKGLNGHKEQYSLIDIVRKRFEYPDLLRCAIDLNRKFRPRNILVEDHGSGISLIQDLRRHNLMVSAIKVTDDKVTRLYGQTNKIESGLVYLPETALWLPDFKSEILAFPYGRYDDQVDSLSQFLNWITNRTTVRFGSF